MNATITEPEQVINEMNLANYSYARETFSFDAMRKQIGVYKAIQMEREYQGVAELEQQSRIALDQVNDILRALRRPTITEWPKEPLGECDVCGAKVPQSHIKGTGYFNDFAECQVDGPSCCRKCRRAEGVEDSDWTPVDEALSTTIVDAGDFYYFPIKSNKQALEVSADVPGCDIVDLRTDRPMTIREAEALIEDEPFVKLGLGFQETLNCFIGDVFRGLYPELDSDVSQREAA